MEKSFTWKTFAVKFVRWFMNAGFFYLGWLVCMHQAKTEHPYLGPLVVAGILIYHFVMTKERKVDAILCVCLSLFGTLVDSVYIWIGMLSYEGGYAGFPLVAPLWITSLWALYAICVNHSLKWLDCNILVGAGMGAGGAISSYLVGFKLGAVDSLWSPPSLSLAVIGLVWAITVPVSLKAASWLKKSPRS